MTDPKPPAPSVDEALHAQVCREMCCDDGECQKPDKCTAAHWMPEARRVIEIVSAALAAQPSPSVERREEIARLIADRDMKAAARLGDLLNVLNGTSDLPLCPSPDELADAILALLAQPATVPSPPSTAGTEED